MKTYEEMAHSALERVELYKAEKEKQRKRNLLTAAPAVGLCLAGVIGIGVWQGGSYEKLPSQDTYSAVIGSEEAHSEKPLSAGTEGSEKQTPAASESVTEAEQADPNAEQIFDIAYFLYEDKTVSGPLYWALQKDPSEEYTVKAEYRPVNEDLTSFVYNGRTLEEWAVDAYEKDTADAKASYVLAYHAWIDNVYPSVIGFLADNGIACERTGENGRYLTFRISGDALRELPLENSANWRFSLCETDIQPTVTEPIL